MEYLSSIVFHTVILIALKMRGNKEIWLSFYIEDNVGMEYMMYLSSIVFHTVVLKTLENEIK